MNDFQASFIMAMASSAEVDESFVMIVSVNAGSTVTNSTVEFSGSSKSKADNFSKLLETDVNAVFDSYYYFTEELNTTALTGVYFAAGIIGTCMLACAAVAVFLYMKKKVAEERIRIRNGTAKSYKWNSKKSPKPGPGRAEDDWDDGLTDCIDADGLLSDFLSPVQAPGENDFTSGWWDDDNEVESGTNVVNNPHFGGQDSRGSILMGQLSFNSGSNPLFDSMDGSPAPDSTQKMLSV
eukprot:gene13139-15510_t